MSSTPATAPRRPLRRVPLRAGCARPHPCPPDVRLRVLSQVPFFAGLSAEQLRGIDRRMASVAWAEGDRLYQAGEPAEHLYVLAAGRAKVVRPRPGGQEVVLDLLAPGDVVGGLTSLGQVTYDETVLALSTTCALRIGSAAFRDVLATYPEVALRVLDDTAARLAQARTTLTEQSTTTVAQRVAATLVRLGRTFGQERPGGGTLIQVPLSRADLAGMTGSTPESVSRAMSRLRAEGIIDSGRRWTTILDHRRLEDSA